MVDEYRWCVHCGADCWPEDAVHQPGCPQITGLWPATGDEVCGHCHQPVEVYVEVPLPDVGDGTVEVCCVGCAFLATLV